jgi:hypothetical protein
MAHYAFLDKNNVVTEVIPGRNEDEIVDGITDWEQWYGDFRGQTCKRTSYNTHLNKHANGETPFRGNYAGIGYTYHEDLDIFMPPRPYPSWVIHSGTASWQPPAAKPNAIVREYYWDEDSRQWLEYPNPLTQTRP